MGWLLSSSKSHRRSARKSRRAPKRNRTLTIEDLEGRRLLSQSQVIQSVVNLPPIFGSNILSGPDGDLWLGASSGAIDRIGLDGAITSFPVPENAPASEFTINYLTNGPDGNVWFEASGANPGTQALEILIGNMTPSGHVTEFPPIPVHNNDVYSSVSLVSGPSGDLWFGYTDLGYNFSTLSAQPDESFVLRVTTAGAVTVFPLPSFGSKSTTLESLAAGADGNLWFTENAGPRTIFARMSPTGVVTRFPIDNLDWGSLANGPNGTLIVNGQNAKGQNEVFRVTTAGDITRYKIPAAISSAFSAYMGTADGSLWFGNNNAGAIKIGRITASGVATSDKLSIAGGQHLQYWMFIGRDGFSMAAGRDGNLYLLVDVFGKHVNPTTQVYRLSPSALSPVR